MKRILALLLTMVSVLFIFGIDFSAQAESKPHVGEPIDLTEEVIDVQEPVLQVSRIIVLDPGHGPYVNQDIEPIAPGSTTMKRKYGVGAAGVTTHQLERELNLNVALMLRDHLEDAGYTVVLTRLDHETIASNIDRANIANELKADLMLRIHADSHHNQNIQGASMLVPAAIGYVVDQVDVSRHYGTIILSHLIEHVQMKDRGVITRYDQTGFNWSQVPIMTVEMGFLSNPDEDRLLAQADYQAQIAFGLFLGIEACFEEEPNTEIKKRPNDASS